MESTNNNVKKSAAVNLISEKNDVHSGGKQCYEYKLNRKKPKCFYFQDFYTSFDCCNLELNELS